MRQGGTADESDQEVAGEVFEEDVTLQTFADGLLECLTKEPGKAPHLAQVVAAFVRARVREGVPEADAVAEATEITTELQRAAPPP